MPNLKTYLRNGTELYAIEPEFSNMLPDGCIEITEEEAAAIRLRSVGNRAVPQQVSRFQARAALLQAGLLDDIEAYMSLDTTDAFTRLAWTDAQEFRRQSPMVASIGVMFGFTSAQLDDIFVFAATIEA